MATAKDKILEHSMESGGFITTSEMTSLNIAYGSIRHLVETGVLTKITRGVYRMTLVPRSEHEDYYMMSCFFKKPKGGYSGIVGAISALDLLNVTELMPSALQFAVEPNYRTEKETPLRFESYPLDGQISENRIHYLNGLPLQRAADAIALSLKHNLGQRALLKTAFEKAIDLGLIKASEETKIRELFNNLETFV